MRHWRSSRCCQHQRLEALERQVVVFDPAHSSRIFFRESVLVGFQWESVPKVGYTCSDQVPERLAGTLLQPNHVICSSIIRIPNQTRKRSKQGHRRNQGLHLPFPSHHRPFPLTSILSTQPASGPPLLTTLRCMAEGAAKCLTHKAIGLRTSI